MFWLTTDLVAVTTGDIASDEVKHGLLQAQAVGNNVIKNFVCERLITKKTKFHEKIAQQKCKTFEMLYLVPVTMDRDKTLAVKADRDLFRRVIVALESGRDVHVDLLLQKELSLVPLSLATVNATVS